MRIPGSMTLGGDLGNGCACRFALNSWGFGLGYRLQRPLKTFLLCTRYKQICGGVGVVEVVEYVEVKAEQW